MVQRKVKWTLNALNDKLSIFEFWYEKNGSIEYPLSLEDEFFQITQLLKTFDDLGKSIPGTDKRCIVKDNFQIIYKITGDFIEILHIWDTRQDPKNLPL